MIVEPYASIFLLNAGIIPKAAQQLTTGTERNPGESARKPMTGGPKKNPK